MTPVAFGIELQTFSAGYQPKARLLEDDGAAADRAVKETTPESKGKVHLSAPDLGRPAELPLSLSLLPHSLQTHCWLVPTFLHRINLNLS